MAASRYLITAALYILKNERSANWKQLQQHVMLIQKAPVRMWLREYCLTGLQRGPSKRSSHCASVRVCVCTCARHAMCHQRAPIRPFRTRRASSCPKQTTVHGAGNCVTGLGIKCARLNDKSSRCVRACVPSPRNVRKQGRGRQIQ